MKCKSFFAVCNTAALVFPCLLVILMVMPNTALAQICFFTEDFESGPLDPNRWKLTTSAQGEIEITTDNPLSGSHALRLGKSSDTGGYQTQTLDLKYDMEPYKNQNVELEFWILDYADETHVEDGLFFSNDGGASFQLVLPFRPSDWCDNTWGHFPPIDVDELARAKFGTNWATKNFVIRWQQHDNSDQFGDPDGFFLEDICLKTSTITYFPVRPGLNNNFKEDFENCKLGPNWVWRFADKTNTLAQIPTRPSNYVGFEQGSGFESNCAVFMGKRCDDAANGFVTNALDLHLDLAGQTQVAMTFVMKDNADETQVDDGLYFSNDGGKTFKKALAFFPSDYCDEWGWFPPLDIDELAAKLNMAFTKEFVIRFQQHDNSDVFGDPDGLYLDDINVYIPQQEYVKVTPLNKFCDDFETGIFGPMWAWRWATQTSTLGSLPTRPSNYVGLYNGTGAGNSQFSVGFGKRCDDGINAFVTNALDLYLDLSSAPQVALDFEIFDYADETQVDDGIYFSNDGGLSFKKAFSLQPSDWCDNLWGHFPPLDIDELAAKLNMPLTKTFVIRFQQHDNSDEFGDPDGFYIDNVCVYVPKTKYVPVPFFDNFENGELDTAWAWRIAETTSPTPIFMDFTRPSNWVEVEIGAGNNSQYGVKMGKRCDDGAISYAVNALDLHLNLIGAEGVKLQFDMLNYYDESQNWDAIFFSNDGGKTFKKVFNLEPGNLPNNVWKTYPTQPLNVDALAQAPPAMPFTDKFVIRFQQYDNSDAFGDSDGVYLDNIRVTAAKPTTATMQLGRTKNTTVFPNPSSDNINVVWSQGKMTAQASWQLLDTQGSTVRTGKLQDAIEGFVITIKDLNNGIYWLEILDEMRIELHKIVKM